MRSVGRTEREDPSTCTLRGLAGLPCRSRPRPSRPAVHARLSEGRKRSSTRMRTTAGERKQARRAAASKGGGRGGRSRRPVGQHDGSCLRTSTEGRRRAPMRPGPGARGGKESRVKGVLTLLLLRRRLADESETPRATSQPRPDHLSLYSKYESLAGTSTAHDGLVQVPETARCPGGHASPAPSAPRPVALGRVQQLVLPPERLKPI